MMKWMLAAGAAALAITAPVTAQHGGGGKGKAQASQAERGGKGQARTQRSGGGKSQAARTQRSGGGKSQAARTQGGGQRAARAPQRVERTQRSSQQFERQRSPQRAERTQRAPQRIERAQRSPQRTERVQSAQRDNRGRGQANVPNRGQDRVRAAQVDRRPDRATAERVNRVDRADNVRIARGADREVIRGQGNARFAVVDRGDNMVRVRDVDRGVVRVRDIDRDDLFVRRLGYGVGGCPPGLANKGCMPPGQAAKFVGQPLVAATRFGVLEPLPRSFNNLFWDNDDYYYRYGGGYVYRVDRDDALIAAMIPLFGAALIGQPLLPRYVNSYYQPSYFNAFYPNSPYDCYRNGYGYVYETDCVTGLVEDVIPTYGYGYGIGQILPASYGYYNLPYQYRSYYVDNDDYYYRYAPGAIYQVDRDTALISAVVSLLAGGLTVGQPLPLGYSAYNVPLAYRTTYYDTPDVWYRYNNGYIYAVDPGTHLVNSVAYAIV